ncbi:MAG: WG repeat-containing protein [Cyanobacteria bacterium REEB67]|nr:WG repeat-containing protein [Cyanobacteria bacterium REEB67]
MARDTELGPPLRQIVEVTTGPCGFPDTIRDGLAPCQYFRMAEVLLGEYDLANAKKCLQKLRATPDIPDAQKYIDLLTETAMPKEDISEEALKLLKDAEEAEKQRKIDQAERMYQSLLTKFPRFEWAYVSAASLQASYRRNEMAAEKLLDKALTINPYNVYVLQSCLTLANNKQQHEKAYKYCMRIRAVDPTYYSYNLNWEIQNHDRESALKNTVHRAAPRVLATTPQATIIPQPDRILRSGSVPTTEAILTNIRSRIRNSIQQSAERSDKYPPQMIDQKGNVQIAFGPNVDTRGSFSDGLLPVQSNRRTQYWNKSGKQAFAKSFDAGKEFSDGLAAASDGLWGFIDTTGQFVIANQFDGAKSFSEGLAAVSKNGHWGFVNSRGDTVIEPIYEKVMPFSNGLALVKIRDKIGYLDQHGRLAILPEFDSGRSFSDGMAEVGFLDNEKHELKLCYIDTTGKICIDTSKIEVSAEPADEEPNIYKLDDSRTVFGFRSACGMSASEKLPRDFHCGLAGIKLGKNYGYINKNGQVAIQPKYRAVYDFSENLATVQPGIGFTKELIDTSGKLIVPLKYQEISPFQNGLAAVSQWREASSNALWGFIDRNGAEILPLQYFEATPFLNGLARVRPTPMSRASANQIRVATSAVKTESADQGLINKTNPWTRTAIRKLAANWPPETACHVDKHARFAFKLDHAGNVYDITFVDGCASPQTMLAIAHSLLFAMPFEVPPSSTSIALDLESDPGGKPKFSLRQAEVESPGSDDKISDDAIGYQKAQATGILRQSMYRRLLVLCERSAKNPDSPTVRAELNKIFETFGLAPQKAHDWLSIARSNRPSLSLRQNPDDRDGCICNAFVGAIFQAVQLQRSTDNLHELEDAYRYKFALDLLRASGAKPLSLAMAAELLDKNAEATKYYSQCDAESAFAKEFAVRFSSQITKGLSTTLAKDAAKQLDWRTTLNWLPIDSEVLIAILRPESLAAKGMASSANETLQSVVTEQAGQKADLQFAIHGGRNFQTPREIGLGSQVGASIKIFTHALSKSAPPEASKSVTATYERLAGFEVIVEERKEDYGQSTISYIATPYSNVEIVASDRHYLRQILTRIADTPTDRAFPDCLPEWSMIDKTSDCWALRHYDHSCAPFDKSAPTSPVESDDQNEDNDGLIVDNSCIGFTYSGSKDGGFNVSLLGRNPKTLKLFAEGWNRYSEINTGQFWETGKGPHDYEMKPLIATFAKDGKSVTMKCKTTQITAPALSLILLNQLGYMVAL